MASWNVNVSSTHSEVNAYLFRNECFFKCFLKKTFLEHTEKSVDS